MKACCCTQWGVVPFIWVTKHFAAILKGTSRRVFKTAAAAATLRRLIKAALFSFCIGCLLLRADKSFTEGRPSPALNKHTRMETVPMQCLTNAQGAHAHTEIQKNTHAICLSSQPSTQTTDELFFLPEASPSSSPSSDLYLLSSQPGIDPGLLS